MADIAASDVTYTIVKRTKLEDNRQCVIATIAFGNGALTYPAGGVPLTKANLACPANIDSLSFSDLGATGMVASYDITNAKIRLFRSGAVAEHAHDILVKDSAAGTAIAAAANALNGNFTDGDKTITGAGAGGGVRNGGSVSAAVLAEVTGVAIAATTLKVTVIGW